VKRRRRETAAAKTTKSSDKKRRRKKEDAGTVALTHTHMHTQEIRKERKKYKKKMQRGAFITEHKTKKKPKQNRRCTQNNTKGEEQEEDLRRAQLSEFLCDFMLQQHCIQKQSVAETLLLGLQNFKLNIFKFEKLIKNFENQLTNKIYSIPIINILNICLWS